MKRISSFGSSLPVDQRRLYEMPFGQEFSSADCREYALDQIREDENEHDILIYIRTCAKRILRGHDKICSQDVSNSQEWPGEETIRELSRPSDRLFIYAVVVFRYIDEGKNASKLLKDVLRGDKGTNPFLQTLDSLYGDIMAQFCKTGANTGADYQDFVDLFKAVVCAIITVFDPPTEIDLALLLDVELGNIKAAVMHLYSVLDATKKDSEQNVTIQLMNQSFRDFLLDQQRSLDPF